MSSTKRVAANLVLALAGVAFAFIVAEIAVRVTGLAKVSLYTWDAYRGWGLKPGAAGWQREEGAGFVSVNSAGFRGPEWTIAKPPGTLRIAVIGDSFTEAPHVAYDETFCAVAERALGGCKGLGGRKVQVMDFGIDAYGTAQELITLRRDVWQYSPDAVVLAFFSGNDVRNNSTVLETDKCRPFYVFQDHKLVLAGPFERSRWFYLSCMMRFESRHSQVLNLIGDAKSDIRSKMKARKAAREAAAASASVSAVSAISATQPAGSAPARAEQPNGRAARAAAALQPAPLGHEAGLDDDIYRPPSTPVMQDAWRVTDGIITMIARETAAHHVPLLVVTIATPPQIYPSPLVRSYYAMTYHSSDLFYPDERITALGAREGFEVLNLAPPMQAYADAHQAFLAGFKTTKLGVGHWNADGHRVAGELIAQKICAMLSGGHASRTRALSAPAAMLRRTCGGVPRPLWFLTGGGWTPVTRGNTTHDRLKGGRIEKDGR